MKTLLQAQVQKGIAFTFLFALLGYGLSWLPGFHQIGPLASAILLAVVYRQVWGYPEALRPGIQFSCKKLLRLAIVLFGLKLNIVVICQQGVGLLIRDTATIIFSIVIIMTLAKWLKADRDISLLLGVGTGVCGAAAIAAISPILKAKEEDTAIGVGIIALIGTVFAIAYTLLQPALPISAEQYGIWSGLTLHELAHVALAGAPAGQDALALALLAKLGRVFLLIPLSFLFMYVQRTKQDRANPDREKQEQAGVKPEFPWFLLGFIAMSFIGSFVLGKIVPVSTGFLSILSEGASFFLAMAMVGIGLHVSVKDLRTKAIRPLITVTITSLLLSILSYFTI